VADVPYPALDPDEVASLSARLFELVSARFGGRLSADQVDEVRGRIQAQIAATEQLHRFPLTNADEPAFVLDLQAEETL
jgi:hypothetical protein